MMPELELVMTLRVEIAPALEVGEVGAGFRRVIPITGGSFEGPAIRGELVPGGRGLGMLHAPHGRSRAGGCDQRWPDRSPAGWKPLRADIAAVCGTARPTCGRRSHCCTDSRGPCEWSRCVV
jgi:hypothetical protein